jgi:MerR family transcriptional regulator, copper efflux regulator
VDTEPVDAARHHIGEVAEAVGLSLRTIRYYEETGLVLPCERTSGGFRLYTDRDIDRLRLIKQMKPLDLTLDEMRDLLATRDRLADPRIPNSERAILIERLSLFAELVEQRCLRLREQLDAGQHLSVALRAEATIRDPGPGPGITSPPGGGHEVG